MKSINYTLLFVLLIGLFGQSLLGSEAVEGFLKSNSNRYWFVQAGDKYKRIIFSAGNYSLFDEELSSGDVSFCSPDPGVYFSVTLNGIKIPVERISPYEFKSCISEDTRTYDIASYVINTSRGSPVLFPSSLADAQLSHYSYFNYSSTGQEYNLFLTKDKNVYLRVSPLEGIKGREEWYKFNVINYMFESDGDFAPCEQLISLFHAPTKTVGNNNCNYVVNLVFPVENKNLLIPLNRYPDKKFYLFHTVEVPWDRVMLGRDSIIGGVRVDLGDEKPLSLASCLIKNESDGSLKVDLALGRVEKHDGLEYIELPLDLVNPALLGEYIKKFFVKAVWLTLDRFELMPFYLARDSAGHLIVLLETADWCLCSRISAADHATELKLTEIKRIDSDYYIWLTGQPKESFFGESQIFVPLIFRELLLGNRLLGDLCESSSQQMEVIKSFVPDAVRIIDHGHDGREGGEGEGDYPRPTDTNPDVNPTLQRFSTGDNNQPSAALVDQDIQDTNNTKNDRSVSKTGVALTAFAGIAGATGVAGAITKALALRSLSHKIKRAVSNGESAIAFKEKRSGLIKQLLGFGTVGLLGIIAAGAMIKKGMHLAAA